MSRIEKTIFISYRRTNYWTALAVFQNLHSNGYDVFFDYESIPSGDFEQTITESIKASAHFIVILSSSALERCKEPGDWLRREIEVAIDNRRNIIPLMMEGFDFDSPSSAKALTGKLANLNKYNAIGIPPEYFDQAMSKLRSERYLNRPLEQVTHPISGFTKQFTKKQKSAAIQAPPVNLKQLLFEAALEELNLSENVHDSLKRTGITTVGEVINLLENGEAGVISIRKFGEKSLNELRDKMREKGFMNDENN